MPSEKRARKRAAREAKLAELERQRRRRSTVRRTVTIAVVVAAAVGIYFAVRGGSSTPKSAVRAKSTTRTTLASSSTTAAAGDTQASANAAAVAAGCPPSPTTELPKQQYPTAPAMTIDTTTTYTATVKTDLGSFVITLNPTLAPHTVNNFVFLAEHDYYNCVIFHRVIPGFMDQTGDRTGTGGPGYTFDDELPPKASPQYPIGSVAMANSGPNTNGSQFFIVTGSEGEDLPASYTLFGTVTSGMNVVQEINADGNSNASDNGVPPKIIHRMLSVTIASS